MKKQDHIIVYCFNSLKDPLISGLILDYLIRAETSGLVFHLITHEHPSFRMGKTERSRQKELLREKNIQWHPVTYHSGKFILMKKAFDFIRTFFIVLRLRITKRTRTIMGFLPVAGGYSAILSKVLFMRLVVYCFEPHSEYMADFGIWKRSSLKYKLLRYFEKVQVRRAKAIVVPTNASKQLILDHGATGSIFVRPISVDTELYCPDTASRRLIRDKLPVQDRTVLLYTGKFGGIYYNTSDLAAFFNSVSKYAPELFLLIITNTPAELVQESMLKAGIARDRFHISGFVPYSELPSFMNAADLGLLAVPPFPSQRYRTPVKTGLYLSCGLPLILNPGIAEDDLLVKKHDLGVVVPSFNLSSNEAQKAIEGIRTAMNEKENIRARCRAIAVAERSSIDAARLIKEILS